MLRQASVRTAGRIDSLINTTRVTSVSAYPELGGRWGRVLGVAEVREIINSTSENPTARVNEWAGGGGTGGDAKEHPFRGEPESGYLPLGLLSLASMHKGLQRHLDS